MNSPTEASEKILARITTLDEEMVPTRELLGRVPTHAVRAPLAMPPWDNSAMDGYAVRAADVERATEASPVILQVIESVAAGGFRDMTRIAAGHPGIWPDILSTNREAVLNALDAYVAALLRAREIVESGARDELIALLERARAARRNLPAGVSTTDDMAEFSVPVTDREGVLAEVTTLAGRLGVNISDFEIAHSLEGASGVLVFVVAARGADAYEAGLIELGYHVSRSDLA